MQFKIFSQPNFLFFFFNFSCLHAFGLSIVCSLAFSLRSSLDVFCRTFFLRNFFHVTMQTRKRKTRKRNVDELILNSCWKWTSELMSKDWLARCRLRKKTISSGQLITFNELSTTIYCICRCPLTSGASIFIVPDTRVWLSCRENKL